MYGYHGGDQHYVLCALWSADIDVTIFGSKHILLFNNDFRGYPTPNTKVL